MVYQIGSRSSRFKAILLYVGSSLICCCATALLIKSGSQYGADNIFSAVDRFFLILIFIAYSSLISPILLNWALKDLTISPIWKGFASALSLVTILLLINAFPLFLYITLVFLLFGWLTLPLFLRFRGRNIARPRLFNRLLLTGTILIIISTPYHWWVREGFPGRFSSMQSRHEWALNTFRWSYSKAIQVVNQCPTITENLGEIRAIAPTEGRNYSTTGWADPTQYGFTLEILGSEKTGTVEVSNSFSNINNAEISPPSLIIRKNIFNSEIIPVQCP